MKLKFLLAIITFLVVLVIATPYITLKTVTVEITGKERIPEVGYLVFSKEETFKNTDSFAFLKFNSSDLYGKFQPGQICTMTVNGFRVPLLSSYRNILKAEC